MLHEARANTKLLNKVEQSERRQMKLVRYQGHIIGFKTKKKHYLWDALTDRAIKLSKKA